MKRGGIDMSQTRILLKHEEKMRLEDAASLLESVAKKLREGGSVTINLGEQSETVVPSENVKLEVELEEKNGKYELEFELKWHEDDKDSISIT